MWWRSRARVFFLRTLPRRPPLLQPNQVSSKPPASIPPRAPRWAPRPVDSELPMLRFFSSAHEAVSGDDEDKNRTSGVADSNAGEAGDDGVSGAFRESADFLAQGSVDPPVEEQSWNIGECEASTDLVEDGGKGFPESDGRRDDSEAGEECLSLSWEESVQDGEATGIFVDESTGEAAEENGAVTEIDMEQVEKVQSLLRRDLKESLETSLDQIELELSEDLMAMVLQTPGISCEKLVGFFRWALRSEELVPSSRIVELLVNAVSGSAELSKMDVYKLWDLVKEIGSKKSLLNTLILNHLISMCGRVKRPRTGLEIFNQFSDFGCNPDANTYYLTVEALRKKSLCDDAWLVCEKMLSSGNLPDGEKVGKIIAFLCKGKKVKEAHSVYLIAHEKEILLPNSTFDSLISSLSRKDETLQTALELLDHYPSDSLRYANATFASVVNGLCKGKNTQEAKKLLLRMVDSGPAPGSAAFNYVITAFSKGGEMEDAIALMKVMESRGLRPDTYTYSVIMSGFAKGGLMDEAYEIYREAKKKHSKLSRVSYHVLIRGYCKMEEYEKALNCLKEMKDDGVLPNSDEYNKIIRSLCLKALDWHTAEKLLEEMTESGVYLNRMTHSLIAAVKELEEEALSESVTVEA